VNRIVPMRLLAPVALVAAFGACGGSQPLAPAPATEPAAPAAGAPRPDASGAADRDLGRTLTRAAVRAAVAQGLGVFLQHVELDGRPVMVGTRFLGFRIAALRDPSFWRGVDLRPGDVVLSVNGSPIERPEQAQTVFDSLPEANELRVAYDRDGQPREIVYTIVDGR
jgi:general secretion pathway protein C